MKKSTRNLTIAIIAIAFIAGIIALSIGRQSSFTPAMDFTLPVIDQNGLTGSYAKLSDFKGKVILLEFAVEWCPHCRNMAPIIKQIYENFNNKGLVVITVMLSTRGADVVKTANFIKQYQSNWLHLYDIEGKVQQLYNIQGTPTYFIIDKKFNIVDRLEGEQSYNELANKINQYLSS